MKVLVTGGAGFIGSNLAEGLVKGGHEVSIIDNLALGKKENFNEIKEKITFYKGSINDDIRKIINGSEVVFHLAALPRVQFSIHNPIESNNANINGSLNLLKQCTDLGVKRFIFSSSSSVYGDQDSLPLIEDMKPNPMSPYALQKLTIEYYCKLFYDIYGLKTTSLRYFNVYGPKQDKESTYSNLIPKFIGLIQKNEQPKIHGDGSQTRDFTYVNDVVSANVAAMSSDNKKIFGKVFNIGAGNRVSVNEVAEKIINLLNSKINPIHVDPVIEPKDTLADISKAKNMLGWQPKTNIDQGLEKTVHYFKSLKNNVS
ncbi:GDP-mannose 4,6-dehydratase [Candidatus Pacearchaeota archaeon]|nr:GDP-mannose 4,6-dehydratase [Candidatus Pacearchaeota archaeon]